MNGTVIERIVRSDIADVPTRVILNVASAGMMHLTRITLLKRAYPYIPMSGQNGPVTVELTPVEQVRRVAHGNVAANRTSLMEHYEASLCGPYDYHMLGWSLVDQDLHGHDELLRLSDEREAKSAAHHLCLHIIEDLCRELGLDITVSEHLGVLDHMLAAH